jgi:4-amino-4-deoxy-L-arabinose transferase-like glycosyltransferase
MTALARWPSVPIAGVTGLLLLVLSGRYGYHRDELYFLEAGHHLDWGYPDQPPLVPAVARLMSEFAPGSVVVLRLPSTLIATAVVLLAGALARRLGARTSGEAFAAAATALSGFVLGMGHLLSTATFDLLGWTALTYLVLRLVQGADPRWWLAAGVVAGLTLQANVLVGFLLVGLVAGLVLAGPRSLLRSAYPWVAATVAFLLGLPYLVWQARHGWPQLDVAGSIASGGSGSSASRPAFVPLLLLQVGPWLAPVWIAGLVRLWRDRELRCFAATFGVLLLAFLVLGGKPYYLAGLFPLLLAAGAQPVVDWAWRWVPAALLALSLPALVVTLPILPVAATGPVIDVNYDVGETIGWPMMVRQIAAVHQKLPPGTPIVASNYGEAGAVDRYGPALGLPSAYSGHNAYADWGRPADSVPALVIGVDPDVLHRICRELTTLDHLVTPHDVDNDEDGTALSYCVPRAPWREVWDEVVHIG